MVPRYHEAGNYRGQQRITYRRNPLESIASDEVMQDKWMEGRLAADSIHSQLIGGDGDDVKVHIYWFEMMSGLFVGSAIFLLLWRARRRAKERENWRDLATVILYDKRRSTTQ